MRDAIDVLLAKHHGQKDFLSKVDAEYAALVQTASRNPCSLLHPTTKQHISRHGKLSEGRETVTVIPLSELPQTTQTGSRESTHSHRVPWSCGEAGLLSFQSLVPPSGKWDD
uniref:Uncharacterized protein n=1 Tax=Oryzias sinensis TaxID=183150 RepID=A0A8C7WU72_9TELE